MSDVVKKSGKERQFRKIKELKWSRYVDTVNGQQVDCEPSEEAIRTALDNSDLESLHYHDETLVPEWKSGARSIDEWGRLVRSYHARRIAYLVANKCEDAISIRQDGFITDGNHRVRAAAFRGLAEIEVVVVT